LPTRSREILESCEITNGRQPECYRVIGDAISGLTDAEAISTYNRLMGVSPGSIFNRQIG
jgi:dGTP triphosphohydrolase